MSVKTWYPALDERNADYQLRKAEIKARQKYAREMLRIEEIRSLQERCRGTLGGYSVAARPILQQAGARPLSRISDAGSYSQSLNHSDRNQGNGTQALQTQLGHYSLAQESTQQKKEQFDRHPGGLNHQHSQSQENQSQSNKNQAMNNQQQGQNYKNQAMNSQQQGKKNEKKGQNNQNQNKGQNNQNQNNGQNNQNQNNGQNNQKQGHQNINQASNNQKQGQKNQYQGLNNQQQDQRNKNQGMNFDQGNLHESSRDQNNMRFDGNQERFGENKGNRSRSNSGVNRDRRNSIFDSISIRGCSHLEDPNFHTQKFWKPTDNHCTCRRRSATVQEAYPSLSSGLRNNAEIGLGSANRGYQTPRSRRSSVAFSEAPHYTDHSLSLEELFRGVRISRPPSRYTS